MKRHPLTPGTRALAAFAGTVVLAVLAAVIMIVMIYLFYHRQQSGKIYIVVIITIANVLHGFSLLFFNCMQSN